MTRTRVKDLDLKPGDILLLRIEGFVGLMVDIMQRVNRDTSYWTHAAMVLEDDLLFEAQPGGAVITPLSKYANRPGSVVRYQQNPSNPKTLMPLASTLTNATRKQLARLARESLDIGYNWGTYGYLALTRFGVNARWIRRRAQDERRLICSQAVDLVYNKCDVHLFADGRMPYDVTPGDLGTLATP